MKPQIVLIATPNYLHKKIALTAIKRGVVIIKEKPLAMNLRDALEIYDKARKKNINVFTLQQRYYSALFNQAGRIIFETEKVIGFSYRFTLNNNDQSWSHYSQVVFLNQALQHGSSWRILTLSKTLINAYLLRTTCGDLTNQNVSVIIKL